MKTKKWEEMSKKEKVTGVVSLIIIIFFVFALFSGSGSKETNTQQTSQETVETSNFADSELTDSSVRKEVEKLKGLRTMSGNEITEIKIVENMGTENVTDDQIVILTYKPKSVWDEKDTVQMTANTAVEVSERLFKHPKVGMVRVTTLGNFTDQYGNSKSENAVRIGLQRATAEKLNYDTFKDMVLLDYNKLLDIADELWMHAALRKEL